MSGSKTLTRFIHLSNQSKPKIIIFRKNKTMSTPSQLAKRFREVLLDGNWIANTNFKDQLSDVTWEQATTRIADLNTIAMLTLAVSWHIIHSLEVFSC